MYGNAYQRIPNDVLLKTSTVMTGKVKKHLRQAWADPEVLALKEWLLSRNITPEKYPHFFELLEAYLRASEQKNVAEASEQAKWNLTISADLDDANLPGIFEIC